MEGHPNLLQNIVLCCWNDLLPFYRHYPFCTGILGQQLLFKHQHRGVVPIIMVYRNLKREVCRTEKRLKIAIVLGRRRCSREGSNGFVKADVK